MSESRKGLFMLMGSTTQNLAGQFIKAIGNHRFFVGSNKEKYLLNQ